MFELIRRNTKVLMFVLVVLIIPSFVFLGVEGYNRGGESSVTVAEVAGSRITQAEWDAAHRNVVDRARSEQPDLDARLLDTPEAKQRTLDEMLRQRVLLVAADKLGLAASDERVRRLFQSDPQLAFLRKPDGTINADVLRAQGIGVQQFEQQLRQDVTLRQVLGGLDGSSLAPQRASDTAIDALLQQREVRIARFEAARYVDQVKPGDTDLSDYYKDPAHAGQFDAPEQARIEYLVLDLESVMAGLSVSEDDLRKSYDENASRYATAEERRASHILVKAERGAAAAERDKARAKAESLRAQVQQAPARFAELAKANSDDPGSAAQGGDLDFFGRGAMVKPFEEAAFALKPGELSEVVESDFGYHVIQLTAVRGGAKKTFEAARAEIEVEVKQQLAQRRFSELAEIFTNTVFEQADSLQPAADALKLKVQTAAGVLRTPVPGPATAALFANEKFLAALFSSEAVRSKRNTEAIELGSNQFVAARILEHAPARKLPLDEVKDKVRERVVAERSKALAREAGAAKLAAWKAGESADALDAPITISRAQSQTLPRPLIEAVMQAPATTLPAWVGVDFGEQGYAVVRIDKLLARDTASGSPTQLRRQYAQLWGAAEAEAYYAVLKDRYKVRITGRAKPTAAAEGSGR